MGGPPLYPDLRQTMSNDVKMLREELNWVHKYASGAKLDAKLSGTVDAAYEHDWAEGALLSAAVSARNIDDNIRFQTATALDLRASLSRNWSSVDNVPGQHNRLMGQTPLSATLGADYKRGPFSAGGSFVFKNGGEVQVSANQVSYESVRRDLDLYALWKFDPKRQLRIAASSLLGQDYISESSRTTYPGSPMLRATLEMKF